MATSKFNSKSPTIRRIMKEASELSNSPSPDYTATPLESDLFEWHFTLRGPPNSPFAEGIYHGRIVLPPTYPLRPPSFRFTTPSGRFEANREICLSISGHHEETWQPAWGVRTAIVALRSFMETDASGQIGGLNTNESVRRKLATESKGWTCSTCGKSNQDILKDVEEQCRELEGEAGSSERQEVEIPAELKMGFRDEMEKAKAAEHQGGEGARDDDEATQLAEGFVQTAPAHVAQAAAPAIPARPAQGVPQPTRTVPLPDPVGQAVVQRARNIDRDAGVPVWIDYAIVGLVGVLIAMLIKILMGRAIDVCCGLPGAIRVRRQYRLSDPGQTSYETVLIRFPERAMCLSSVFIAYFPTDPSHLDYGVPSLGDQVEGFLLREPYFDRGAGVVEIRSLRGRYLLEGSTSEGHHLLKLILLGNYIFAGMTGHAILDTLLLKYHLCFRTMLDEDMDLDRRLIIVKPSTNVTAQALPGYWELGSAHTHEYLLVWTEGYLDIVAVRKDSIPYLVFIVIEWHAPLPRRL
ncbi:ubiquitin-conjugating enzyme [Seiridium cupressi]